MLIMNGLVQWDYNLLGSKTCWEALVISSKWILCITTKGLISLISTIFQPIAFFYSWSILINWFSQKSSNFGGSTIDGNGDEESGKGTTFGCQLSILKRGTYSNNALTSLID